MPLTDKIKNFFKLVYDKLIKIDDSPQKIAFGFGLGVFCGILPGTGPVAALALSWLLRVNKVAALTGGILTNSWLSVVTFLMAVKIGSAVTGANWNQVYEACEEVIKNFNWENIKSIPFSEIILPLLVGYLVVGSICGVLAYFIVMVIIRRRQKAT